MNKTTAPGIGEMKTSRIVAFWVLIGLFLIAHLAPHAGWLHVDEWNNMTCAWLVAQGWVPYRDFFTHHPPFPYWFAAPAVRLFGPATETFRYTLMFFYILALVALYRANRRSAQPFSFGLFVLFVALGHGLYWGHLYLYDGFLAFLLLMIFYEFWRYDESHRLRWSDWVVIALAVFASLGSGLIAAFPLTLLAVGWAVKHFRYEPRQRRVFRALGGPCIVLVPFLCAAGYLWATGALYDFYLRVIRFSVVYYRAELGYTAYAPAV
jgi:4-amino-4-deoxy-L-arabinose transferase-like glycosyltransferase